MSAKVSQIKTIGQQPLHPITDYSKTIAELEKRLKIVEDKLGTTTIRGATHDIADLKADDQKIRSSLTSLTADITASKAVVDKLLEDEKDDYAKIQELYSKIDDLYVRIDDLYARLPEETQRRQGTALRRRNEHRGLPETRRAVQH